jgi:hypothetical protein
VLCWAFLAFAFSLQTRSAHNMLVLMLDPCFKNLQLIRNYVRLEVVMKIVIEYDHTILMPLCLCWAFLCRISHGGEKGFHCFTYIYIIGRSVVATREKMPLQRGGNCHWGAAVNKPKSREDGIQIPCDSHPKYKDNLYPLYYQLNSASTKASFSIYSLIFPNLRYIVHTSVVHEVSILVYI